MYGRKCVCLNVNANISNYQIEVYDNCGYKSKVVYGKKSKICFYTTCRSYSIVATPLQKDYYNKIYLQYCNSCFNNLLLNLNFDKVQINSFRKNVFYLNDKNYGLKIDGNLIFNSL